MTARKTALSLASLKAIIAGVDGALEVLEASRRPLIGCDLQLRDSLLRLRGRLEIQFQQHPDNTR